MDRLVKNVMEVKIVTLLPKNLVKEAVFLLVKYDSRFLPVIDENNFVIGAFSESDLMKLVKTQPNPNVPPVLKIPNKEVGELKISEVMTPRPITINAEATITDALEMMYATNLKVLIVTDNEKKFVGLVRFRKLIESLLEAV